MVYVSSILTYSTKINKMSKAKEIAIQNLSDEISPVISEYIQETIAWQTEGHEFTENLDGDSYIEFVKELQHKIIQNLYE